MASANRNLRLQHHHPLLKNTTNAEPVVLGVDVGTTATRASLACLDCDINKPPEIVLRPDCDQHGERFEAGDFPSAADFFAIRESPERCIGYIGDSPDQTPVKMYLYIFRIIIMRNEDFDGHKEYEMEYRHKIPQLDQFFRRFNNLGQEMQLRVIKHAQQVFLAHLTCVRLSSEELAESRGWKIIKLAATIPPNWDRWTQHFYIYLLTRTWSNLDHDDITLLHESEAIGHWLLGLDQKTRKERPKRLILADFGGHTLSYNVFDINYHDEDINQFSFFTLSVDNCFHGGSELHASSVKQIIGKEIDQGKIVVSKEEESHMYKSLMNDYRQYNRSNIDGKSFSIRGWTNLKKRKRPIAIDIHDTEAWRLYESCFNKPLQELYGVFRTSAKSVEDTVVVLNGGSFSNVHIMAETKQEIHEAGLKYLPWTKNVSVDGRKSSTVAVGAAMALAKAVSVKQFMDQAAFAVTVGDAKEKDVPVIWNSNGPQKASITLQSRHGADVLIVCCPLAPYDGALKVPVGSTFEFQSLSKKVKGNYTIRLDFKEKDDRRDLPDRLILTVRNDDAGKTGGTDTVEWPVYYDPGSCVIFIDIDRYSEVLNDGRHVPELVPQRFRNKRGAATYLRWEKNRLDPSRIFWEHLDDPGLPLYIWKDYEAGTSTHSANVTTIEGHDSDFEFPLSSPTPNIW